MSPYQRLAVALLFLAPAWGLAAADADKPDMAAKCNQLLDRWKDSFQQEKLNAVVAPPFVIAGDASARQVGIYRDRTILWAANCLKKQYFKREPDEPILILLFETAEPYRRLSKQWFKSDDPPHYGYFRHDNIMVMNVGTGTGTLVHELTHALLSPDFPNVPSWFNEGLASLYEQCTLAPDGSIRGLENWRLPALQKAIKADELRPLARLIEDPNFYARDNVGLNYAQARYLMFYLQEKGLLSAYYQRFRDGAKDDPNGLATLRKLIEPQSLEEFEKDWKKWVLTLRFR